MGLCKLCLKERNLQLSHFMPKAAFRSLRGVLSKNPNPTLVTNNAMVRTSYQMTDYLLCEECEDRFNRLGERWVLPRIASKSRFPLLESVSSAPVVQTISVASLHACAGIPGIDVEKITYFAMSILWRSAAHDWKKIVSRVELGPYLEGVRRWLLGEIPFPENIWLLVTVASGNKGIFTIAAPIPYQRTPYHAIIFYIPGIEFVFCIGKQVDPIMRKFCVYTMADHPIGISDGVAVRLQILMDKFISGGVGRTKLDGWLEREKQFGIRKAP